MIEAAVSAPRDRRHTSPDRTWARRVRGCRRVCSAHEESSASLSIQSCTASWRTVSCSTATITSTAGGTRWVGHVVGTCCLRGRADRRAELKTECLSAAWECLGRGSEPRGNRRSELLDQALREHVQAEAAEGFLRAERHRRTGFPRREPFDRNVTWSSVTATSRWSEIATGVGGTARDSGARDWAAEWGLGETTQSSRKRARSHAGKTRSSAQGAGGLLAT